ncbi:hypothetical protein [Pseudoxanthomonas mexicana]|uniref:hypothetical protein n=1 Tax=Pseudoxanthomonas mexicana TaxID=128785 RepID=UPI0007849A7C|nr:hypothetical protein [Pseudoxanthomonas mexicana]
MTLLAVSPGADVLSLNLTGCAIAVYSSHAASRPLSSLIALSVESVDCSDGVRLDIRFSSGDLFSVSLLPEHYVGPEAFSAEFSDGTYVVV